MNDTNDKPRIQPGGLRDVGLPTWVLAKGASVVAGTSPLNLFLTLGRHRRVFWGWLHFSSTLMPFGRLDRRDTELVILRVATLRDCRYELEHHLHLAPRYGLHDDEIRRVSEGPEAPGWTAHQQVLLQAVDTIHEKQDLDDETWRRLREHLDERRSMELCLLVAQYEMLATTIAALRIQPDGRNQDAQLPGWARRLQAAGEGKLRLPGRR